VPPQVWTPGWVTHCPPAGTGTEVLTYCAPSLYRMAITTNRLAKLEDEHVTFRVKERTRHAWTPRTLPVEACSRRFLQPVLPQGFPPSRHTALAQLHTRFATCPSSAQGAKSRPPWDRPQTAPAQEVALHCRTCAGPLVFLVRLVPN
jgi:Putative transposase